MDESQLVQVDDMFDVLLISACLRIFASFFFRNVGLQSSFPSASFSGLGINVKNLEDPPIYLFQGS